MPDAPPIMIQGKPVVENCVFRGFEPGDLPRLHQIREAAFRPVFLSFRTIVGAEIAKVAFASAEREQADLLDRICAAGASHDVLIAVGDGEIVAFCAMSLDRDTGVGEIGLNAVHPDHQSSGIGAAMYALALDRMRAAGMRVATVGTGGDPSHAPARRAYEKAGFGPAIPSLHMYRMLDP